MQHIFSSLIWIFLFGLQACTGNLYNQLSDIAEGKDGKLIFVTKSYLNGNLLAEAQNFFPQCSGLSFSEQAADCICQAEADAAGSSFPKKGLKFHAMLFSTAADLRCKIQGIDSTVCDPLQSDDMIYGFPTGFIDCGPDGCATPVPLAKNIQDLLAGKNILHSLTFDSPDNRVWTGANGNGNSSGQNCNDWTSNQATFTGSLGFPWHTNAGFLGGTDAQGCDLSAHLLCIEEF